MSELNFLLTAVISSEVTSIRDELIMKKLFEKVINFSHSLAKNCL